MGTPYKVVAIYKWTVASVLYLFYVYTTNIILTDNTYTIECCNTKFQADSYMFFSIIT